MQVTRIGMDIAKQIFDLHGVDRRGKVVLRRTVRRERLLELLAQLKPCTIGMEACGGAHYWHREISGLGHTVRLLSAHKVKPYVDGNKNNRHDAAAICEAMSRPSMRFVQPKSQAQQDLQTLHRARTLVVRDLTALSNQMRGLLHEYGIVVRKGVAALRRTLPQLLEDDQRGRITAVLKQVVAEQFERFNYLAQRLDQYDRQITQLCQQDPRCRRLLKNAGIGPLSATALVAAIGNGHEFKNGRHFSAYLGLVPGHSNTGDHTRDAPDHQARQSLSAHPPDPRRALGGVRRPPPHRPAQPLAQSAAGSQRLQSGGSGAGQQKCTGGVGGAALWRGLPSVAGPSPDASTPPPRAPLGQRNNAGLDGAERPPRPSEQSAFFRPAPNSHAGRDEKNA